MKTFNLYCRSYTDKNKSQDLFNHYVVKNYLVFNWKHTPKSKYFEV